MVINATITNGYLVCKTAKIPAFKKHFLICHETSAGLPLFWCLFQWTRSCSRICKHIENTDVVSVKFLLLFGREIALCLSTCSLS